MRQSRRKGIRIALLLLVLLIVSCLVWGFFIEPNRLVVNQQSIQIDTWPKELGGFRIALIADLHTGGWFIDENKLRMIVHRTNQLNPDLVVLLGDYVAPNSWHSRRVEPEITAGVLKDLRASLGVYAVLGNHDWWYNGAKVRRAFEQNGIPVLEDEVVEIGWRDKSFWLAGLADLWTRPQHIDAAIAKTPPDSTMIVSGMRSFQHPQRRSGQTLGLTEWTRKVFSTAKRDATPTGCSRRLVDPRPHCEQPNDTFAWTFSGEVFPSGRAVTKPP